MLWIVALSHGPSWNLTGSVRTVMAVSSAASRPGALVLCMIILFVWLQEPHGIFDLIEVVGNGTYGQVYKVGSAYWSGRLHDTSAAPASFQLTAAMSFSVFFAPTRNEIKNRAYRKESSLQQAFIAVAIEFTPVSWNTAGMRLQCRWNRATALFDWHRFHVRPIFLPFQRCGILHGLIVGGLA